NDNNCPSHRAPADRMKAHLGMVNLNGCDVMRQLSPQTRIKSLIFKDLIFGAWPLPMTLPIRKPPGVVVPGLLLRVRVRACRELYGRSASTSTDTALSSAQEFF